MFFLKFRLLAGALLLSHALITIAAQKLPAVVTLIGNHDPTSDLDQASFEIQAGVMADGRFWIEVTQAL